jgi:hypothetical protein
MKADKTYWFGPKRIGFGFGPRTWQGWATTGVYAFLMFLLSQAIGRNGGHDVRVAGMTVLTIAFLAVFFWKLDSSKR